MDDLNIYYIGGAGGFYLMHQLLITGKFWCSFGEKNNSMTFDDVRTHTFDANRVVWKDNEIWPDNHMTLRTNTEMRKLYMFNNMWGFNNWEQFPGTKLALYMDEKSWLRMIARKGAALYWDKPMDQYFTITRTALKERAYDRYISTSLIQAGDCCYTWQDIASPIGLGDLFRRLGISLTDKNTMFMQQYLMQHDRMLLQRIMGSRISEIEHLL